MIRFLVVPIFYISDKMKAIVLIELKIKSSLYNDLWMQAKQYMIILIMLATPHIMEAILLII